MMERNSGSMHNSFGELLSLVRTAELSGRQDVLKRHRNILLQQITDLATSIIDATDRVLPSGTEERMSRHVDPNEPGPLSAISAFRDACPLSNRLDCFSNNRRTIKNSQTMILSSNNPEASSYMRTPIGARKPTHVEEIELTEEDILATLAHRRKQQQPYHEIFQLETTEVESRDGLAPRRVPSCCFTQTFFASDSVKDEAGMREPSESLPNYGAGGDYYMTPSADGLGTPVAVSVRPLENISMVSKCISKKKSVLSTISIPNEADIAQINPSHIIHKNNVVLNFESTVPLLDSMYAENKTEENTRKPIKTTVNSEEGRIVLQHVIASDRRIHTMIFREPPMSHGSGNLDEKERPMWRRHSLLTAEGPHAWSLGCVLCLSLRGAKLMNPSGKHGSQHYGAEPKLQAGKDVQLKHTEMYDGYTDDFGVFKEGPPTSLRLEYIRSPDHGFSQQLLQKDIWSPFQVNANMMMYTPLYYDWKGFSSRDYWGHRSGTNPGSKVMLGHYRRDEHRSWGYRIMINHKPQKRVPKWLACVVHLPRNKSFVGFFLYANGAYVAELLTYKQLPRICYNKPFQGCMPTIGQTVALSEVTYGKELHSVEMYPGHGGVMCRSSGTAAVVLRGSEPNLVPLLLPSKEVRLFDNQCHAVFGRRAGVMYRYQRNFGKRNVEENMPHRPKVHSKTKRVSSHPAGGGNAGSPNLLVPLDWRIHPRNCVKTKYWLSGYILRGRQYNKGQTVADIKSKTYSWANRDPVYR